MNFFIIAQIFGALGALSMILSSWQKSRKRIFLFLVFDNVFCFLQYLFLQAYAGAFTNVVGFIRTLLFSKKGENKFLKTNYPLILIILLYIGINIFTFDGISSLFPAIASIIYAFVLWQDEPRKIRFGSSIMLFMWFVYNLCVKAYVGAVVELILFISSVVAIIKIDIRDRKKENKDLVTNKKEKKIEKKKKEKDKKRKEKKKRNGKKNSRKK